MKPFLLILFLLVFAFGLSGFQRGGLVIVSPSPAAAGGTPITKVAVGCSRAGSGTSLACASGFTAPAASLVVIGCLSNSGNPVTGATDGTNSFTELANTTNAGTGSSQGIYARYYSGSTSVTPTCTYSGGSAWASIYGTAFNGAASASFQDGVSVTGVNTTGTALSTSSFTPGVCGDLLVEVGTSAGVSANLTASGAWTMVNVITNNGDGMGYNVLATSTATPGAMTSSASGAWYLVMVALKAASHC